jgi:hypothetical protein
MFYKRIVPLGADLTILFIIKNKAAVSRITFDFHPFCPMSLNNISVVVRNAPNMGFGGQKYAKRKPK